MLYQLIKEIPRGIFLSLSIFIVLLIIRLVSGVTIQFNEQLVSNFGYTMLYGMSIYLEMLLYLYI